MFVFPFPLRDGVGAEANIEAFPLNRSNVLERTATDILMKLESVALYVFASPSRETPTFLSNLSAFSCNKSAAECGTVHPSNRGYQLSSGFLERCTTG